MHAHVPVCHHQGKLGKKYDLICFISTMAARQINIHVYSLISSLVAGIFHAQIHVLKFIITQIISIFSIRSLAWLPLALRLCDNPDSICQSFPHC